MFEMLDRCSRTGLRGWSVEMMEAMSEMDDEADREEVEDIKKQFPGGGGRRSRAGGENVIRKFLQERRQRERKTGKRRHERRALTKVKKRMVPRR